MTSQQESHSYKKRKIMRKSCWDNAEWISFDGGKTWGRMKFV